MADEWLMVEWRFIDGKLMVTDTVMVNVASEYEGLADG